MVSITKTSPTPPDHDDIWWIGLATLASLGLGFGLTIEWTCGG